MLIPARRKKKRQCNGAAHIEQATVPALSISISLSLSFSLCLLCLCEFRFCNRPELLPIVLPQHAELSPLWRFVSNFCRSVINEYCQLATDNSSRHPDTPPAPSSLGAQIVLWAIWKILFNSFIFFRFLFWVCVCFRREFLWLYPARG